jgi:Zn-dependent peptidase ImmA (M78 family)
MAAEDVAASERSRLDLGEGPLLNLREILEADVGLRIFQMDLPANLAGMYVFTESLGGCIAVNLRYPLEHRRASLGHELGHFLTARYRPGITFENRYERRPAGERFAEVFARAFLIPATGLRRRYLDLQRERPRGVTHGDLYRLAHFFAVSVELMTRRLEELRLIPAGTWDRLRQEGGRMREVPQILDQEPYPARYVALAVEAWQGAEISEGQLARFLRTDRIGAREKIQGLFPVDLGSEEQRELIDFGVPLLRAACR